MKQSKRSSSGITPAGRKEPPSAGQPPPAATPFARPTRWERILSPTLLSVVLADSLVRLLPWQCRVIDPLSVDGSWISVIQDGFLEHKAFGREIILNYGPWGFAMVPSCHPSLFSLQLGIQSLLVLLLMLATWRTGRSVSPRPAVSLVVAGLLCLAVIELVARAYEILYPLLLWHFALNQFGVGELAESGGERSGGASTTPGGAMGLTRWLPAVPRQALVTAAALISLMKFSYAAVCMTAVPAIVLRAGIKQHRLPSVLPAYLLQVMLFWWLAGQQAGDLPHYLRNALDKSSGYTAMALPGPWWHVPCFLAGGGLVLTAIGWERWRAEKWFAAAAIVSLGMVFVVLTKASFVRHDWSHFVNGAFCLPALCLTTCASVWRRPIGQMARSLAVGSCIPAVLLAWPGAFPNEAPDTWGGRLRRVGEDHWAAVSAIRDLLRGTKSARAEFDKEEANLRSTCPIPTIKGTFDCYPYGQSVLFAHSVRYNPRPVVESYEVSTPRLARLNAEHLRAASSPDCILFGLMPLDFRYPSLEDGLSWPDLLSRYEPDTAGLPFSAVESVVLRRSEPVRPCRLVPVSECETEFGHSLEVPGTDLGPVWAEITVAATTAGKLAAAALKPPQVFLDIRLTNGGRGQFLFLPGMAQGGFLLSPFVADVSTFGWIAATPWRDAAWQQFFANRSLRSITLPTTGAWAYQKQIAVRFYRLEFAAAPSPPYSFAPGHLGLLQLEANRLQPCNATLRWVPGLGTVLLAPGGTRLGLPLLATNAYFSLSPEARSLRVAFGGLALRAGDPNAGWVGFRVVAYSPTKSERILWHKTLSPPPEGSKTMTCEETVPLELGDAQMLGFETVQGRAGQSFIPFWSGMGN